MDLGFTFRFVSEAVLAVPRLIFVAYLLFRFTWSPRGGDGDAGLTLRNLRLAPPPPLLLPLD